MVKSAVKKDSARSRMHKGLEERGRGGRGRSSFPDCQLKAGNVRSKEFVERLAMPLAILLFRHDLATVVRNHGCLLAA